MEQNMMLDSPIRVTDEEIAAGQPKAPLRTTERTDKEMMWLIEYLKNGNNAYQAAIQAGYSESAASSSSAWVRPRREDSLKKDFWDIFRQAKRRRLSHLDASRERVMLEYTRIAMFDPAGMYDDITGELLNVKDMPEDTRRAIAGFDVTTAGDAARVTKIKLNQKNAALKDLSLILGITKETVVHEHKFSDLLKEIQETDDPLVVEMDNG